MSDAEQFTLPGGGPPEEWPRSWTGQYVRLTLQGSRSPGERGDDVRHEEVAGGLLGVNTSDWPSPRPRRTNRGSTLGPSCEGSCPAGSNAAKAAPLR